MGKADIARSRNKCNSRRSELKLAAVAAFSFLSDSPPSYFGSPLRIRGIQIEEMKFQLLQKNPQYKDFSI